MEALGAPSCWRTSNQGIVLAFKTENSEEQRPPVEIYQVSLDMKMLMILSGKAEDSAQVLRAAGMPRAEVLPHF